MLKGCTGSCQPTQPSRADARQYSGATLSVHSTRRPRRPRVRGVGVSNSQQPRQRAEISARSSRVPDGVQCQCRSNLHRSANSSLGSSASVVAIVEPNRSAPTVRHDTLLRRTVLTTQTADEQAMKVEHCPETQGKTQSVRGRHKAKGRQPRRGRRVLIVIDSTTLSTMPAVPTTDEQSTRVRHSGSATGRGRRPGGRQMSCLSEGQLGSTGSTPGEERCESTPD